MPVERFVEADHPTPLGIVHTWSSPPVAGARRPVVFAMPGILSKVEDLFALGEALGLAAEMCVMRLPSRSLTPSSAEALSKMCGELIEGLFPERPVVAFGVSSGALIALGMKAANLARIVAVEPPLMTGALWPIAASLTQRLRELNEPVASAFALETLGVAPDATRSVSRLHVLGELGVPADVILGSEPLEPPRTVARFPSLVGAAARRALAAAPGVRLHVVPDTGHNVLREQFGIVRDVLLEACRRGSVLPGPERVDEPLLEATPLTARRILYLGPGDAGFAAALRALNPAGEIWVEAQPGGDGGLFDAVVLAGPPEAGVLTAVATQLRPGGHLIARWAAEPGDLRAALAPHGLALREPVDRSGTGVIRAQRLGVGVAPQPAVLVRMMAFAPRLMDIRTRLPVRGLRSDPDLAVTYELPPFELATPPNSDPRILVVQRPAETRIEVMRPFMAQAIREGWLTVMEYDDYPPLIAEMQGASWSEADFLRFGYMHAVQTATAALADAFRPYNPETVVFPNAVFDLLPFPETERPPRVVYSGVLRGPYAVAVARSLAPAIAQHPETEFVVIGDREVFDALPAKRKRYYGYMSFEAYLDLISTCCISLSPIEAAPMRETKSDAKFLDASRAGVLTIASPTIYDRTIEHGVNGLLAPQVEDWSPLLARALSDGAWRQAMARRAWDDVRAERMFADQVALRADWYRDLWSRRDALNAAIMARMPGLREAVNG